jgi:long-chain acyl-CoA synthetase
MKNSATSVNSYRMSDLEREKLKQVVDYSFVQSLPEIWSIAAQRFEKAIALHDPHTSPEIVLTYRQLYQQIQQFAAGLQANGILPTTTNDDSKDPIRVALISDNSPRWMIADQGIMMAGAADVVRSSAAETEELLYIIEHSGSTALIVEDQKTLKKLGDRLLNLPIQLIVLLSDEQLDIFGKLKVFNFSQIMAAGTSQELNPANHNYNTLATLLYTSGTTGKPKGVRLTHGNLLHQITTLGAIIQPQMGDIALSILPTWHTFGRTAEYFVLSQGCHQIYTSIRHIKQDFKDFKPQYMIGVPRLLESVYEGVQKKFREQPENKQKLVKNLLEFSQRHIEGKRTWQGLVLKSHPPALGEKLLGGLQAIVYWPLHFLGEKLVYKTVREATGGKMKYFISGGGSLAMHLENFYQTVGLEILVGYGLTETSPVTHARRYWHNLRGSAGQAIPGTEVKIVDAETRQPLPLGKTGLVLLRGPQIMQGYYKNPEATKKAIDPEGWFDSGDLGWLTENNDLVLTGRQKDTIVLTNGENIEPQPIEDACLRSPYIDQIMLVGQDQRSLGALIVPNIEALKQWANSQNLQLALPNETFSASLEQIKLDSKVVEDLFRKELTREVQNRPGLRPDDRIGPFKLIPEPFSVENGMLTQTLKVRRPVVMERYHDMIDGMFKNISQK